LYCFSHKIISLNTTIDCLSDKEKVGYHTMSAAAVTAFAAELPQLSNLAADRVTLRDWSLTPFSDGGEVLPLLFESTQGTKSRLGISMMAILWWEHNRSALVPGYARAAIATNVAIQSVLSEVEQLKGLRAAFKDEVDQLRVDLSREIVRQREEFSPSSQVPAFDEWVPKPALEQLEVAASIPDLILEDRKARLAAQKARVEREEAQKLQKEARLVKEKEQRAAALKKKQDKKAKQKDARLARAKRAKEIADAKSKGEDPYTAEETAAYAKKLAEKGKPYYTPEQRQAFQKANPKPASKGGAKGSGKARSQKGPDFRVYSDAQKAAYIKENFTDKGRVYYSKEQRAQHKKELVIRKKSAIARDVIAVAAAKVAADRALASMSTTT